MNVPESAAPRSSLVQASSHPRSMAVTMPTGPLMTLHIPWDTDRTRWCMALSLKPTSNFYKPPTRKFQGNHRDQMFLSRRRKQKYIFKPTSFQGQIEDNYEDLQSAFCPTGSNIAWSCTWASKSFAGGRIKRQFQGNYRRTKVKYNKKS